MMPGQHLGAPGQPPVAEPVLPAHLWTLTVPRCHIFPLILTQPGLSGSSQVALRSCSWGSSLPVFLQVLHSQLFEPWLLLCLHLEGSTPCPLCLPKPKPFSQVQEWGPPHVCSRAPGPESKVLRGGGHVVAISLSPAPSQDLSALGLSFQFCKTGQ